MSLRNYRNFVKAICLVITFAWMIGAVAGLSADKAPVVAREASGSQSASRIAGPLLGYLPTEEWSAPRAIWGVPGAALLGSPEEIGSGAGRFYPSPSEYLLSVTERGASLYTKSPEGWVERSLTDGTADEVAFSVSGNAAALWDSGRKTLRVFRNLPSTPQLAFESPVNLVNSALVQLSVSEDGELAAIVTGEGGRNDLLLASSAGGVRSLGQFGALSTPVFLARTNGLLVAEQDTDRLIYFRAPAESPAWEPVLSNVDGIASPAYVGVSRDGKRVFVLNRADSSVVRLDLESRSIVRTATGANAQGLWPMHGNAVFLLTADTSQPLSLYDGDVAQPRVLFVPADPPSIRAGETDREPRPGSRRSR